MMFQISFLNSMAKRYNTAYQIPSWQHSHLFETEFPEVDRLPTPDLTLTEPSFKYNQDFWDSHREDFKTKTVDVQGYFQNEKYFDREETKKLLKFKPEVIEKVRKKYERLFTKPTIAIGIRRGDYVNNPNYYQLPILYYILALQKFDLKGHNIVFFSDDLPYCFFHFRSVNHAFFPKFDNDIEAFIAGTMMDNWIISNSTFHWWSSCLSNAKRVIQPAHLFAGDLLRQEGPVNFFIEDERFEIFDHEK